MNAFLNDETSYVLFYNSEGRLTHDYRPMISFGVVCVMQKGDKIENGYAARSFRKGFEWMDDNLVAELAKEAVDKTNIFKSRPKSLDTLSKSQLPIKEVTYRSLMTVLLHFDLDILNSMQSIPWFGLEYTSSFFK